MAPQRRALKVRVHYWAAASLLKSVLRDSLSLAAVIQIAKNVPLSDGAQLRQPDFYSDCNDGAKGLAPSRASANIGV